MLCYAVLSCFNCVRLFATPWTVACQAPLSMGFSRQEYWSGLPCPSPGDLPDPGIRPTSLVSPALTGGFFTTSAAAGSRPPVSTFKGPWDDFGPTKMIQDDLPPFQCQLTSNLNSTCNLRSPLLCKLIYSSPGD